MAQQFLPTLEVLMGTEKKKRPGYQDEMKIFICGARNAGKAAFVTRVRYPTANPPPASTLLPSTP